jgi:ankyrin repeat protein
MQLALCPPPPPTHPHTHTQRPMHHLLSPRRIRSEERESKEMAADEEHAARCQAFLTAAAEGDLATMEELLTENPGLGMIGDAEGLSFLMFAAFHGRLDVMHLLLDHPSDPAAMMMLGDDQGWIALMFAAINGKVDAMRVLLDHPSADPAAMMELSLDVEGATALVCCTLCCPGPVRE